MADFEIIEADFQQYYGLDVISVKFRRFARLLLNLPVTSRFIQKYTPSKDWDFDKETRSRILMELDIISCQISNLFKKKGAKARKPDKQFQPKYVEQAKKDAEKEKKAENMAIQDNLAEIFEKRNKQLEEKKDGK